MERNFMRHLIGINDLSSQEIDELISVALDIIENPKNIVKNAMARSWLHYFSSLPQEPVLALKRLCTSLAVMF